MDFPKKEVERIGNPAGIGQGTGFGLRERDRDGIVLGHYRLRTTYNGQFKKSDLEVRWGAQNW